MNVREGTDINMFHPVRTYAAGCWGVANYLGRIATALIKGDKEQLDKELNPPPAAPPEGIDFDPGPPQELPLDEKE